MSSRRLLNGLALLVIVALAALGRWQLDRGQLKREQLAAAAAALAAPPLDLAVALGQPETPVRRVAGAARFLALSPLWLDNQRRGQRVGVRMYCTVVVAESLPPLLVDLGWLPLAGDRQMPAQTCPRGAHALGGLLVPPPSTGLALGPGLAQQGDGSWLATRLEPAQVAVAQRLPTLSARVLRLDPALALGFERDLELLANTLPPEKHRGYAVQWFGLAAAMLVITLVLNLRRTSSP